MKPKFKVYLDTTIPNILYDNRDKKLQQITEIFWTKLDQYEIFISQIVVNEIIKTPNIKRRTLLEKTIKNFSVLDLDQNVITLVKKYMRYKLIPKKDIDDAYHLAVASINKMDYLLTWNFEHLLKERIRIILNSINSLSGYNYPIKIITPGELI